MKKLYTGEVKRMTVKKLEIFPGTMDTLSFESVVIKKDDLFYMNFSLFARKNPKFYLNFIGAAVAAGHVHEHTHDGNESIFHYILHAVEETAMMIPLLFLAFMLMDLILFHMRFLIRNLNNY